MFFLLFPLIALSLQEDRSDSVFKNDDVCIMYVKTYINVYTQK